MDIFLNEIFDVAFITADFVTECHFIHFANAKKYLENIHFDEIKKQFSLEGFLPYTTF